MPSIQMKEELHPILKDTYKRGSLQELLKKHTVK